MSDILRRSIRETMCELRQAQSFTQQAKSSRAIYRRLIGLEVYRRAKHLALYMAINGEVNLQSVWQDAPLQGKQCYFPVLHATQKTMVFLPATPATSFKENRFGILEPEVDLSLAVTPAELDVILMPLVAFDPFGHRLGMGGGYYDYTLASLTPRDEVTLLGVAYDFQYLEAIPNEPWDKNIDGVVTETTSYWC